jgi:hypothetical protein
MEAEVHYVSPHLRKAMAFQPACTKHAFDDDGQPPG